MTTGSESSLQSGSPQQASSNAPAKAPAPAKNGGSTGGTGPVKARKASSVPGATHRHQRPWHLRFNSLMRWLHTYVSMFSLMVVLLFSVTGITLNHPEWIAGSNEKRVEVQGQVQADWVTPGAEVKKLEVAEFLRKEHGFRGLVTEFRTDEADCTLSFKAPGYAADGFLDRRTGKYQFTVAAEGFLAVINDLHRGRNAGKTWAWAIDISSVILIVVSLTGLAMLFFLKKTRTSALWTAVGGLAVLLILLKLAL